MKVYLKNKSDLYTFYTIEIKDSGLYVHCNAKKGDHFSYHADGTCFHHFFGKRLNKKIRKPLNKFKGIESLSCVNMDIHDPVKMKEHGLQKFKDINKLNDNDFIIERSPPFCFELILSDKPFKLPDLPERINSEYHQNKIGHLYLTLEIFNRATKYIATLRYQPNKWVTGKNAFDWIDDKWQ